MTKKFLLAIFIFFALAFANGVFAATSPKNCETDTMKNGELCSWADGGKSWCGNNTLSCTVEPTGSCPANPTGGTYNFDCNSCACNLTCTSGYTKCTSSTCTPNCTPDANCSACNTCTGDNCTACNAGYELIAGACTAAPLKLSTLSNVGGFIKQITSPTLTLDSNGNLAPTGDLQLVNNKSIALTAVGTTSLWFGNYNGSTPFAYGTGDVASIAVEGDIKGNRICFQDDCRADWASVTGSSVWTRSGSYLYPTTISDNVGIGITAPTQKLYVNGSTFISNNLFMNTMNGSTGISWYNPSYYTWFDYMKQGGAVSTPSGQAAPTDTASGVTSWARRFNTESGASYGWIFESGSNSASAATVKFAINASSGTFHSTGNALIDGNVGVGTTTPAAVLHLVRNTANYAINLSDTNNRAVLKLQASTAGQEQLTFSRGVGVMQLQSVGVDSVTSYNISLNPFGGNVGIGTTAPPNDAFSIGNAGSAPAGSSNTGHNYTNTYLSSDNYALANYGLVNTLLSSANLWSGTKNGNIWNGDAGVGNVGIGTTNPGAKLEVAGDIKSTVSGASALFTAYNPGTNYPRALFKVGNSASDVNTGLMFAPEYTASGVTKPFSLEIYNNKLNADASARMVGLGVYSTYASIHSLGPNGNSAGLPLIFSTQTYLGNNPAIYISNAASQNVGVGITNPVHKLSVAGTSYLNGQITTNLTGTGQRCLYVDATGNIFAKTADCGTATSTGDNLGNSIADRNIQLGSYWLSGDGGNEGVFVKSDGNVGIGTTSPNGPLEVQTGLNSIYLNNRSNNPEFKTTGGSFLYFSPAGQYTVFNSQSGTSIMQIEGTVASKIRFYGSTSNQIYTNTGNLDIAPSGNTTFSSGNVGIGTTAPNDIFSIGNSGAAPAGSANTGHNYTSTYLSTDNYALTNVGYVNSLIAAATSSLPVGVNFWGGTKNGDIWNGDAGAGNIGIGTTTPTAKLDLVGGNFDLDYTSFANQNGIITNNGTRFIYNFGYGNNGTATPSGHNIFIGENSGNLTMGSTATTPTQSSYNIGLGYNALYNNASGYQNIAIGLQSLYSNTSGYYGTAMGTYAAYANTTGSGNAAYGYSAMRSNSTGNYNVAVGYNAMYNNVAGSQAVAYGYEAMRYTNDTSTTWTSYSTGVGFQALRGSTTASANTGNRNSAFGASALLNNSAGASNDAFGASALVANTVGNYNTAMSNNALGSNTSGSYNAALGALALYSNIDGNYNTAFGYNAGRYYNVNSANTSTDFSTYVGASTKALNNDDQNEIVIGYNALGAGSNSAVLGSDDITKTVLKGNVGFGTTAPNDKLSIGNGGAAAPAGSSATGHNYTSTYLSTDNYALTNVGYVNSLIAAATSSLPVGVNFWGGTKNGNIWNGDAGAGNVGIGTTAPNTDLNINSAAHNPQLRITSQTTNTLDPSILLSYIGVESTQGLKINYDVSSGSSFFDNLYNADTGNIYFRTKVAGTPINALTILGNGNVGIGITDPTHQLELNKSLELAATTDSDTGVIYKGTLRFIHDFTGSGTSGGNIFIGKSAGNFTMGGSNSYDASYNTGVGDAALAGLTTGRRNVAVGNNAMPAGSNANIESVAVGYSASYNSSSGSGNATFGSSAGYTMVSASYNTFIGQKSGHYTTGGSNTILGTEGGYGATGSSYANSTLLGKNAGHDLTSGSNNILIGYQAGDIITSGANNIVIGYDIDAPSDTSSNQLTIGNIIFGTGLTSTGKTISTGNIGIGTSAPNDKFSIGNAGNAAPAGSSNTGHNYTSTYLSTDDYALANYGVVKTLIGSATSTLSGNFLPLAGGTMLGDVNFGAKNITNLNNLTVSKITATTIDPLYTINNVNYSTFAPSISGGVKEEYVGKANISRKNPARNEYEYIINFSLEDEGSDLWLWRKVIDYSDDNVQVFITPAGKFAEVYYQIENDKLIFRANMPVEISYRLIGKRYDWQNWPTKALNQTEKGVVVK